MNFDTGLFLVFLAAVLAAHAAVPGMRGRKAVLLGASYVFYGFWNPPFVLLLAFSTWVDWRCARAIVQARAGGRSGRIFLLGSLVTNLGLLAYFKYSGFVLASLADVLGQAGITWTAPEWQVILPVGISFYTFQSISYTIDVWRREQEPARDWLDFALYVSFFAQLVAGPIVRAGELLPQLARRTGGRWTDLPLAAWLIAFGLFLKVVFADSLFAPVSDSLFDPSLDANFASAWLAALCFAGQIYCDFCGYSTIAIGVALLFGLELPENFRSPYAALGFRDFWRRWHITLSRWLRDYLYVSLGGNRHGRMRTLRNLVITMFLGGLWHGASWNFALWGLLHGGFLVIEHGLRGRTLPGPAPVRGTLAWGVTFLAVCFAWIPFRAPDLDQTLALWAAMFQPLAPGEWRPDVTAWLALAGIAVLLVTQRLHARISVRERWRQLPWPVLAITGGLMVGAVLLAPTPGRPFIYFQF